VGDLVKDATLGGYEHCPVLAVYDLDRESTLQYEGVSSPIAVFSLELGNESNYRVMVLSFRLDINSYYDEVAVPFFRSPSDQLIALQTSALRDDPSYSKLTWRPRSILLIPIIGLTSHIDGATADNAPMRYIPWNDWGATGTRWAPGPYQVYLRFGSLSVSRFIPAPHWQTGNVVVWDFNHARVAQLGLQQCDREFLPCVQTQVALPVKMARHGTMAISEDALICRVRGIDLCPVARLQWSLLTVTPSAHEQARDISPRFLEFFHIFVQDSR